VLELCTGLLSWTRQQISFLVLGDTYTHTHTDGKSADRWDSKRGIFLSTLFIFIFGIFTSAGVVVFRAWEPSSPLCINAPPAPSSCLFISTFSSFIPFLLLLVYIACLYLLPPIIGSETQDTVHMTFVLPFFFVSLHIQFFAFCVQKA
jgi:hypothetical protein